jgi:hypothetical protein
VKAYDDAAKVKAVLDDVDTAPIAEPLRATLRLLRTLTKQRSVTVDDMRVALAAGATKRQLEDALAVAFCFNIIDRCADTFEFYVPADAGFAMSAKFLLSRGYKF